ncbi:hypothetical protein [Planctomicrobium sp. SH664]|uniref:hypothetical protein n=1 Tax=Planctomicrobium sp. SH664 TaxID=3448125 RepID=UPI003F5BF158
MSSPRRFRFLALTILIVGLGSIPAGDLAAQTPAAPETGVVVMTDGRAYSGTIHPIPGGLRVESLQGPIVIPEEYVQLRAPTLTAAYRQLRENRVQPVVADHLILAEWCLQNSLLREAHLEIREALQKEPTSVAAQGFLRKIEAQLPSPPPGNGSTAANSPPPPRQLSLRDTIERSPAGLTRDVQREFISKVQPLLLNSCGNAACHGAASTGKFRLVTARFGSPAHRAGSQENLMHILTFLDPEQPEKSPLLLRPLEAEGVHQGLLLGERRSQQRQLLENWIRLAAEDLQSARRQRTPAAPRVLQASGTDTGATGIQQAATESVSPGSPMGEGTALPSEPPRPHDPFDPAEFNRLMHSGDANRAN